MIQLKDLTLGYGQRILLDRVSAKLSEGGLIALLGRNGSGKSTLLRAIARSGEIASGEVLLNGKEISRLRPEELAKIISFVTTEKIRIPNLKCQDVVALGRAPLHELGRTLGSTRSRNRCTIVGITRYVHLRRTNNGSDVGRGVPANHDRPGSRSRHAHYPA